MKSRSITAGGIFTVIVVMAVLRCGPLCAEESKFSAEQIEFFEKSIRPMLIEHCYECHSSEVDEPEAGLLLDSRLDSPAGTPAWVVTTAAAKMTNCMLWTCGNRSYRSRRTKVLSGRRDAASIASHGLSRPRAR